jgi:hypothetical protein
MCALFLDILIQYIYSIVQLIWLLYNRLASNEEDKIEYSTRNTQYK